MFLIRTLFWLCVIILLLPAEDPPASVQPAVQTHGGVGAANVIDAARTTFNDITSICERSPQVCDTGQAAFDTFLRKAAYGATLVMELVSGGERPAAMPAERQASHPEAQGSYEPASQGIWRNTLRPDDMAPAWNAPAMDRPA